MEDYITADYEIVVGVKDDQPTYQVRNIETDVIEYEDYILPRSIDTMIEMQTMLDKARIKLVDGPKLELVKKEITDEEGGNGLH